MQDPHNSACSNGCYAEAQFSILFVQRELSSLDISKGAGQTIDLHEGALLPRSLEIGFHPFIRGRSSYAPRIWYASLFAKPRCRYQPSRISSRIGYEVDNLHAPPPLRRQTATSGLSFLAAATTLGWPNYHLLDIDPRLLFLPPARRGTRSTPTSYTKVPATAEGEGRHYRWGLGNIGISSRLPSSQLLLSMVLRKGWRKFGQKSYPISPIDWTLISPGINYLLQYWKNHPFAGHCWTHLEKYYDD